jgi:CDGSH-type Zn-finger protein
VGECGRSEGELFVGGRKPWCQPDLAAVSDVEDVVRRCPSGALSYEHNDGGSEETADAENVVVVANRGPLYLRGDLSIDGADDMPGVRFRAALCRCGESKNKPFCDNSHEKVAFDDRGAVGSTGDGNEQSGGTLAVKCAANGPLLLSGNFSIVGSGGRIAWKGQKAALCRCGQSKNKPFCDGSHKAVGFSAP